ncbi:hypothetical protein D9758_009830 [Tetrapyrgos nigripes]|uniref:Uncharacterized protein n=1 Tax=Tetrapyrgos nigripes TaxID=182062 RepID=A0A8H5GMF4_9AGAR|nr:hypothetical protein D9758_009830 [Tetrapyrgos nigripes]
MSRRGGRSHKKHGGRNISGLRNQKNTVPTLSQPVAGPSSSPKEPENTGTRIHMALDSNTRVIWDAEDAVGSDIESDIDEEAELEDLNDKLLVVELVRQASRESDGGEWIPRRYRRQRKKGTKKTFVNPHI